MIQPNQSSIDPQGSDQRPQRALVWWLASVLFPGGLLAAWGWLQQRNSPSAAIPFVYFQVLAVHLLGYLPLSIWLGWQLGRRLSGPGWLAGWIGAALLSLLTGAAAVPAIDMLTRELTAPEVSWLRGAIVLCLQLPWCVAAGIAAQRNGWRLPLTAADGLIALLILALPVIHVQQVTRRQSQVLADQMANGQYVSALKIGRKLAAMGRDEIAGQSAVDLIAQLEQTIVALRREVATPLAGDAGLESRLTRAECLYRLGEFDDVQRVVGELATVEPRAALRLALVRDVQGRWSEAAELYGRVIELLADRRPLDAQHVAILRGALERWVNNLRRINRNREAEQALLQGLEAWPEAKDAVLMQLGYHYQMAGRVSESIDYFTRAAAANPQLQPVVDTEMAKMMEHAEGCMIRSTHAATR